MTQNRRSKRATRERMGQTGEKYTDARRALAAGADGNHPGQPDAVSAPDPTPLGWFSDQAYNLILLADDEARMLNHPSVEPEHLLLAITRRGTVQDLLGRASGPAIYQAIERIKGFGETLVLRPRRSPASEEVLAHAVAAATNRGLPSADTEHLLQALAEQELPTRLLSEIGVSRVVAPISANHPTGPALYSVRVQRRAARLAATGSTPPRPGPIPPVFERFTADARDAIQAGIAAARTVDDEYVEPIHLLLATLKANGIAAAVRSRLDWGIPPISAEQHRWRRATDIFSDDARRIVAEDVLIIAERISHRPITTGHLLIALLENPDQRTGEIVKSLPQVASITSAITEALADDDET